MQTLPVTSAAKQSSNTCRNLLVCIQYIVIFTRTDCVMLMKNKKLLITATLFSHMQGTRVLHLEYNLLRYASKLTII